MNMHNTHSKRLAQEPRYQILWLRKARMSIRSIAQEVAVLFVRVSRMLLKNQAKEGNVTEVDL